jgi:DNA repair protein RadD
MNLRPYQNSAIRKVYASLRENRSCILQLPTGSGKTHCAAAVIQHGLAHGKRIAFFVDRLTLLDQTTDKFIEMGIPVGVVQAGHPMFNPAAPVQVCSIQTVARRSRSQWPEFDLAIVDEAHTNYALITTMQEKWSNLKYIGLTATPFTRGLGLTWNDLVVGVTTRELIEEGHLSEYVAFGPSQPDLKGVKRSGFDYSATDLGERMAPLTGDILAHYRDKALGMKTLGFTPTVAFAQHLALEFQAAGLNADHVSGHDTEERRKDVLDRFKREDDMIVFNCEVLTKGFDLPDLKALILARPTRSLSLHIQMLGRGLRAAEGKERVLILDHAGNIERLGFPDDPLPDELCKNQPGENTDTRKPSDPTPWNCPKCHSLVPPRTILCPTCGFRPAKRDEVEVVPGILKKLSSGGLTERMQKEYMYAQLLHIARERNYSDGWAAHKYRELFKVWPRKMTGSTMQPTPETYAWVTSRDIAWANRKEKRNAV